jgi:hypothetical protein
LRFELLNVNDAPVLGFGGAVEDDRGDPAPIDCGQRLTFCAELDSALVAGRYAVLCSMSRSRDAGDDAIRDLRVIDFVVTGSPLPGMVMVSAEVAATVESRGAR